MDLFWSTVLQNIPKLLQGKGLIPPPFTRGIHHNNLIINNLDPQVPVLFRSVWNAVYYYMLQKVSEAGLQHHGVSASISTGWPVIKFRTVRVSRLGAA